jgi:hypothetical protein
MAAELVAVDRLLDDWVFFEPYRQRADPRLGRSGGPRSGGVADLRRRRGAGQVGGGPKLGRPRPTPTGRLTRGASGHSQRFERRPHLGALGRGRPSEEAASSAERPQDHMGGPHEGHKRSQSPTNDNNVFLLLRG